jgi:hypothetical protein
VECGRGPPREPPKPSPLPDGIRVPMPAEIVIVSGLPRSGTSLMMQMLAAAGIPPFTDGQRTADDDNPRGYFELEQVKRLKQDSGWLADARGKAVKVVSQHVFDLPATERYRIVFMQRDLDEVLASQETMIARNGGKAAPRATMRTAFTAHLAKLDAWLAGQPHVSVLRVNYAALVAAPEAHAAALATFLDKVAEHPIDQAAAAAAVDSRLYRNRAAR